MEIFCRTCLRVPKKLLPLYDNPELQHKIESISAVQVFPTDNFPSRICEECVKNINFFYTFQKVIRNSDLELRERCATLTNAKYNKVDISEIRLSPVDIKFEDASDTFVETEEQNGNNDIGKEDQGCTSGVTEHPSKDENSRKPYTISDSTYGVYKRNHKEGKSMCSICGKSIRNDNFQKHINNHTVSPVPCKDCGKICKNMEALRYHAMIHKATPCEFCGQTFKYRSMKDHVLIKHTVGASKKYNCHLCEKTFFFGNDLKKHIRSHTGEKPYPCEYCKRGFSSPYALKTHVRQHTNERPYKCKFCPQAFLQNVSLRTHLKSKHPTLFEEAKEKNIDC